VRCGNDYCHEVAPLLQRRSHQCFGMQQIDWHDSPEAPQRPDPTVFVLTYHNPTVSLM
jgi:hypothetical protein